MDSQNNSFFQSPSATDPDEARRRFLESMGMIVPVSEPSPNRSERPDQERDVEEGVTLSSASDDLELLGAPVAEPVHARVISYQVGKKAADSDAIPTGEELGNESPAAGIEAVSAEEQVVPDSDGDEEKPLQLNCPECQRDLVLMPQHLGVKGSCVWCEARIVAARSGSDGQVRVFSLSCPDALKSPGGTTKDIGPVAAGPVSDPIGEPAPAAAEENHLAAATEKSATEAELPETRDAAPAWGGGFEAAHAPAGLENSEVAKTPPADSDFAEASAGFGEAGSLSPEESHPVETEGESATADSPSGFGGFEECSSFSGGHVMKSEEGKLGEHVFRVSPLPTEPGLDAISSGFASANRFSEDFPQEISAPVDEAPRAVGFSATPFELGQPGDSEKKKVEATGAAAPLLSEAGLTEPHDAGERSSSFPPPTKASTAGFETPAPPRPAANPEGAGTVSSSGMVSLWSNSSEMIAGWGGPASNPPAPVGSLPASVPAPVANESQSSGFAIPATSTGSFAEETGPDQRAASPSFDSVFSVSGNDDSKDRETASREGAPAEGGLSPAMESGRSEEEFPPPSEAIPGLFGSGDGGGASSSLFVPPGTSTNPPPIPETSFPDTISDRSGNGLFGAAPNVTSKPFGSKPTKKKGKGLVVLLVILLGLVCGAALASFVLPVDEYVERAKLAMEKNFTGETGIDPAAFLSGMVVPDSGETSLPQDSVPEMEGITGAESEGLPLPEVPSLPPTEPVGNSEGQ